MKEKERKGEKVRRDLPDEGRFLVVPPLSQELTWNKNASIYLIPATHIALALALSGPDSWAPGPNLPR